MEELCLVVERLGVIVGYGGWMNGLGIGSWIDFFEILFLGMMFY